MNQLTAAGQRQPTMSSREIAELAGKQHSKVLRDIRSMLIEMHGTEHVNKTMPEKYRNRHSEYIREHGDKIMQALWGDDPNWDHRQPRGFEWSRDSRGYITEIRLDRYHSEVLVTGYDVNRRAAVIRRWMELEQSQPARPQLPDFTDPAAAARAWADEVEQKRQAQERLADATPRLEALDRIAHSQGRMCITNAAKLLQVPPRQLFSWMKDNRWIYRRGDGGGWVAFQKRLTQGHLEHKVVTISQGEAPDKVFEQVLVTRKGLVRLGELISKVGGIDNVVRGRFPDYPQEPLL